MFHVYGLILGLAIVGCWWLAEWLLKKKKSTHLLTHILWIVVWSVIWARLYHVVTDWQLYEGNFALLMFAIWRGGLGIYGAVLGGMFYVFVQYIRKKLSWRDVLLMLDVAAFVLPFGQAVGRLGNYFNHELFGIPTRLPWGLFVPAEYRPFALMGLTHYHPLFAYEALALLLFGGVCWIVARRSKFASVGTGIWMARYMVAYGVLRFLLDILRLYPAKWGWFTVAQWVSMVWICFGLIGIYKCLRRVRAT